MRFLFILAAIFVNSFTAASAQTNECVRPDITECPNLYADQCRTDEAFQTTSLENMRACIAVLSGSAEDAPSCAAFDPASCVVVECDSDGMHPLKAFYCENGYPSCPQRIPDLQIRFDNVLTNLDTTLLPYQDLIELDPETLSDTTELCAYSTVEITSLQERARLDNDGIAGLASELQTLRECNRLTTEFMEGPRPPSISSTLWENIRTTLSTQIKVVAQSQGAVDTRIEALQASPRKIADLQFVHDFACASEPQGD